MYVRKSGASRFPQNARSVEIGAMTDFVPHRDSEIPRDLFCAMRGEANTDELHFNSQRAGRWWAFTCRTPRNSRHCVDHPTRARGFSSLHRTMSSCR